MLAANELAATRSGTARGPDGFRCRPGTGRRGCRSVTPPGEPNGQAGTAGLDGQDTAGGADGGWPLRPGHGLWAGAAGRRPGARLAGAGRDGGDGGLCAAHCGSTARTGRRAGLLTVRPGSGSRPGPAGPPPRTAVGSVGPAGRGYDVCPAWSRRVPDPYPPRTGALRWGHSRGPPDGWPGNPRSPPGGGLHGGRPGGQDGHGPQKPAPAKAAGPAAPGTRPPRRRGRAPDDGVPGDAVGPGRRRGLCCRPGRTASRRAGPVPAGPGPAGGGGVSWPCPEGWTGAGRGRRVGLSARSWFLPGAGATSGIGSGPRLSSGFAGWPPVRGKL